MIRTESLHEHMLRKNPLSENGQFDVLHGTTLLTSMALQEKISDTCHSEIFDKARMMVAEDTIRKFYCLKTLNYGLCLALFVSGSIHNPLPSF